MQYLLLSQASESWAKQRQPLTIITKHSILDVAAALEKRLLLELELKYR